jgi:hypothetical protein
MMACREGKKQRAYHRTGMIPRLFQQRMREGIGQGAGRAFKMRRDAKICVSSHFRTSYLTGGLYGHSRGTTVN